MLHDSVIVICRFLRSLSSLGHYFVISCLHLLLMTFVFFVNGFPFFIFLGHPLGPRRRLCLRLLARILLVASNVCFLGFMMVVSLAATAADATTLLLAHHHISATAASLILGLFNGVESEVFLAELLS